MVFPQFSLRWLLAVTAACGGFFVVLAQAYAGKQWALAVCVAAVSLAVVAVIHAVLFAGVWLLSLVSPPAGRPLGVGVSPFAAMPPRRGQSSPPVAVELVAESAPTGNGTPAA